MQVVRVKMFDMAYSNSTWDKDEVKASFGLINLDLVGWLVDDRDDCIIIASEFKPDGQSFRHLIAIPKTCITEIRKVRIRGGDTNV